MNRLFYYSNNHMLLYQHNIGNHANEKIQILLQITYFSERKVEKNIAFTVSPCNSNVMDQTVS